MKKLMFTVTGALALSAVPLQAAAPEFVSFETDSAGWKGTGPWSSAESTHVAFSDTLITGDGSEAEPWNDGIWVDSFGIPGSFGKSLALGGLDASRLGMTFDQTYDYISLWFGNDSTPGVAHLDVYFDGDFVGGVSLPVDGGTSEISQTLGISGVDFDYAEFYYVGDPNGYEIVDNILFDRLEEPPLVPEVQTYASLFGAALVGIEMMRRRRRA